MKIIYNNYVRKYRSEGSSVKGHCSKKFIIPFGK